jgi:hypothetical protein
MRTQKNKNFIRQLFFTMERELRRLRRAAVHETTEEKKSVYDATDQMEKKYEEVIKMLIQELRGRDREQQSQLRRSTEKG